MFKFERIYLPRKKKFKRFYPYTLYRYLRKAGLAFPCRIRLVLNDRPSSLKKNKNKNKKISCPKLKKEDI